MRRHRAYWNMPIFNASRLWIADTRQDIESISGMVAGAQIVILLGRSRFSAGNPIAPVIKITGNKATWEMMQDNILRPPLSGEASHYANGRGNLSEIPTASRMEKTTKSEDLGHNEFLFYKIAPTFLIPDRAAQAVRLSPAAGK